MGAGAHNDGNQELAKNREPEQENRGTGTKNRDARTHEPEPATEPTTQKKTMLLEGQGICSSLGPPSQWS